MGLTLPTYAEVLQMRKRLDRIKEREGARDKRQQQKQGHGQEVTQAFQTGVEQWDNARIVAQRGFHTGNQGDSEAETDFYIGLNGKALPAQYKDWIGTNMQQELISNAQNPRLQNAIKQLYRGKSFIGDGGTADVIRFEKETGFMLGKTEVHIFKKV